MSEHYENAKAALGLLAALQTKGLIEATPSVALGVVQAQATLALAHEQRTANLIHWHRFVDAQGDLPDETSDLAAQIEVRLAR